MKSTIQPLNRTDSCPVQFRKGFWQDRVRLNREQTIPHIYEMLRKHKRIRGWDLAAGIKVPGLKPHRFWDSDCTKWIEAAAYSLAKNPDPSLSRKVDALIRRMERAQEPDGYLNMVGTLEGKDRQWINLRDHHELYCAGHLIEAAVAYHQATGKDRLLQVAKRLVAHIRDRIGPETGQIHGYPGHPEIEWALIRLFRHTGDNSHLELAAYFLDQRGQQPHFFDAEARMRKEDTAAFFAEKIDYRAFQAHLPVRDQRTAEGHAVRATYLYTAMAAMAGQSGDKELRKACDALWTNIVERRLYITGGIGSTHKGERFTFDYDLPDEEAYCETCAAIGLIFFAREMNRLRPAAEYTDLVERALFNAVLPGVSLDGCRFFYDNPLAVQPPYGTFARRWPHERYAWHGCACCPPNLARLVASLDSDFIDTIGETVYLHQFGAFRASPVVEGRKVVLDMKTGYPWKGNVRLTVSPGGSGPCPFTLAVRRPSWSQRFPILVNGARVPFKIRDGYIHIRRNWVKGDTVEWEVNMDPQWIEAHPHVRQNSGRIALQRGPIVFCLESGDNPALHDLRVSRKSPLDYKLRTIDGLPFPTLSGTAVKRDTGDWKGTLYRSKPSTLRKTRFSAIPYFMWGNRGPGAMRIWLTEAG